MFPSSRLALVVAVAACGRATSAPATAGAPSPAAARAVSGRPPHTPADIYFMAGMIVHHQQAVVMARWALDSVHGSGPTLRTLAERMLVSQADEIEFMERWLHARDAAPMDHAMLMPGMLIPGQMAELDRARGAEFDRVFLTFMIQHHRGAIAMVDRLLGAPGAAQDGLVFRFAADVHADQTAEIERMERLLAALTLGGETR